MKKRFRIKTRVTSYLKLKYKIQERIFYIFWIDTGKDFEKEEEAIDFINKANKY